jgi:uncharacterized protein (DUF433 family)
MSKTPIFFDMLEFLDSPATNTSAATSQKSADHTPMMHLACAAIGASCKLWAQERKMDDLLLSRDPEVMSGALCFKGTRVPVKNLFDYLEGSSTLEDFLEDFPSISRATAVFVLEAARERLALDATAA